LKQHNQTAKLTDEATLEFSQFAVHTTTDSTPSTTTVGGELQKDNGSNNEKNNELTNENIMKLSQLAVHTNSPKPDMYKYVPFTGESEHDTDTESNHEGDDDEDTSSKNEDEDDDDESDLIRYMSDTSDEILKGQESSDINNVDKEEKPQIEGIPNKTDWGDLPPCTKQSTWGNNLPLKSKRRWEDDTDNQQRERNNSPSNIHHRVTYCEWCNKAGVTTKLNGPIKCHQCRESEMKQIQEAEQSKEDGEETTLQEEENKKEEEQHEDTTSDIPPQTPPRRFRQAATAILRMITWEEATDGRVRSGSIRPATLHNNYYSALHEEEGTDIPTRRGRVGVRPELLQYGRIQLQRKRKWNRVHYKRLHLTQNSTTLTTSETERRKRSKVSPSISISKHTTEMTTLTNKVEKTSDSDSSTTIERRAFQMGEPCESNAESAERHREIERNVDKKKKRRDKRRRKLQKRLQMLLEQQLMDDSDKEKESSSTATQTLKQSAITLAMEDINPHELYPNQDKPLRTQPIELLYDTGASITMLPLDYAPAWRNLRPCLHQLTGCFTTEGTYNDLQIGEFHGLIKLDNGEMIRIIIPEAIALPSEMSTT
jgi:hypothetical protein